jgi:hypothetical protein
MKANKRKNYLYKKQNELTDKKLLGSITEYEEIQLNKIRAELDSYDKNIIRFYEDKICRYKALLDELTKIEKEFKKKNKGLV